MEVQIRPFLTFVVVVVTISQVIALPANQREDDVPAGSFAAEKRPKYLDTREPDAGLSDLVYTALVQLVADARVDPAILLAGADDKTKQDGFRRPMSKRWYQGICHKRGAGGKLVAYFCSKQKRGYQSVCYRQVGGQMYPYFCNRPSR